MGAAAHLHGGGGQQAQRAYALGLLAGTGLRPGADLQLWGDGPDRLFQSGEKIRKDLCLLYPASGSDRADAGILSGHSHRHDRRGGGGVLSPHGSDRRCDSGHDRHGRRQSAVHRGQLSGFYSELSGSEPEYPAAGGHGGYVL